MPELLDKSDVMRIINSENAVVLCCTRLRIADEVLFSIASKINSLQTIQTTIEPEVRQGRWIYKKGNNKETVDGWICTNCKSGFNTKVPYFKVFKYCPMCGARMDATDTNVGGKGGDDNG